MTIRTRSRKVGDLAAATNPCEHRSVSKDGCIVCTKIVEGENKVSPEACLDCPFKDIDCTHLRFSLRQIVPSPLIVRRNGRTEIWDDEPPRLCFEHAACAVRVIPIEDGRTCARCALRQPLEAPAVRPQRQAVGAGAVMAFPQREAVAAAG